MSDHAKRVEYMDAYQTLGRMCTHAPSAPHTPARQRLHMLCPPGNSRPRSSFDCSPGCLFLTASVFLITTLQEAEERALWHEVHEVERLKLEQRDMDDERKIREQKAEMQRTLDEHMRQIMVRGAGSSLYHAKSSVIDCSAVLLGDMPRPGNCSALLNL